MSWVKRMLGNPIPSKQFQSEGYRAHEIGPPVAKGKGMEEQAESVKLLSSQNRGGCPFR
jgi:hypothetical protein